MNHLELENRNKYLNIHENLYTVNPLINGLIGGGRVYVIVHILHIPVPPNSNFISSNFCLTLRTTCSWHHHSV